MCVYKTRVRPPGVFGFVFGFVVDDVDDVDDFEVVGFGGFEDEVEDEAQWPQCELAMRNLLQ